jgi:hypothetical protein
MKKALISVLVIVVMVVTFAVPATADDSGNAEIIARLNELLAEYGGTPTVDRAISDAKTWLATSDPITPWQAEQIIGHIDAAARAAGDATSLAELRDSGFLENVQAQVSAGLAVLDLGLTFDANGRPVIIDEDGDVVYRLPPIGGYTPPATTTPPDGTTPPDELPSPGDGVIKQTGIDTSLLVITMIGITVLFGTAVVVAMVTRKKRLSDEAA